MLSMDFNSKKKLVSYPIFKFFNRSAAVSILKTFVILFIDIMINNDLFVKLVQNNRIKIHEIDFLQFPYPC